MNEPRSLARPDVVTVYGIDSCEDTSRTLRHLDAARVPHVYVNLDGDPAAAAALADAGYQATPVVVTSDGSVSVEPSDDVLASIVASVPGARTGQAG